MTTINIRGIPVSFPCRPYDIQKEYMSKVIECLQNETNGVLESPTGTGKTLSLLCSSLAWLTVQKAKHQAIVASTRFGNCSEKIEADAGLNMWAIDTPTIIYSSRTHSQLTQAMKELKRTQYSHVQSTILGSRQQLCIHPEVSKLESNAQKTTICQGLVKKRACYLQTKVERMTSDKLVQNMNIADIEDLVNVGQKLKFCPYYMTKELQKKADIIFLPYNYLLDPKSRRAQKLELNNSVIIFDEAHNVERVCEDSASFQLKTTDLTLCIEEITAVMKHMESVGGHLGIEDEEKDFSAEDLMLLKSMLLNLETVIDDIQVEPEKGSTFEGKYIFEILEKAGITQVSQVHVQSLLDRLIQFMTTANSSSESPFRRSGSGLQTLLDLLLIVFQQVSEEFIARINQCYKVYLKIEDPANNRRQQTSNSWLSNASRDAPKYRVLSYWCFSANFGMQMLMDQGVRSVIFTSGTLSPLKPLISELGIRVDVTLENPHVITKQQICVKILGNGPDGIQLSSTYENRSNHKYMSSLGMTIINICRQVPSGLLIFFPSYSAMINCHNHWRSTSLWTTLDELKRIFVEPKTKNAFDTVMTEFYDRVKDPIYQGAIFMAVCRGKVSEGLDFADVNGRAVIITGIPYPPYVDPRVVLKRQYLDVGRAKNSDCPTGNDWYKQEATRAVNQAIGRVIRHRNDYGAILLLDHRFGDAHIRNQLSLWVREHISVARNFGEVVRELRTFFKIASSITELQEKKEIPVCSTSTEQIQIHTKQKSLFINSVPDATTTQKRSATSLTNTPKKKKFTLIQTNNETSNDLKDPKEFHQLLKTTLNKQSFDKIMAALKSYRDQKNVDLFIIDVNEVFEEYPHYTFLLQGFLPFLKNDDNTKFMSYWQTMR